VASARSPRRGRLSRSADFDRVLRNGRSHAGRELVLYVFPRGGDEPSRLGLSVSRKVGGAVDRNTVKRMLREAFALERDRVPVGTDLVVIARPDARVLAEREGMSGMRAALAALIDKVPGSSATEVAQDDGTTGGAAAA
jgi:ribonuclease P protein component